MPLARTRAAARGLPPPTLADSAVPAAVAAPANSGSQRGGSAVRRPSSTPAANSATTTVEADTIHEASALMPMPVRSGYTANVSKEP